MNFNRMVLFTVMNSSYLNRANDFLLLTIVESSIAVDCSLFHGYDRVKGVPYYLFYLLMHCLDLNCLYGLVGHHHNHHLDSTKAVILCGQLHQPMTRNDKNVIDFCTCV